MRETVEAYGVIFMLSWRLSACFAIAVDPTTPSPSVRAAFNAAARKAGMGKLNPMTELSPIRPEDMEGNKH